MSATGLSQPIDTSSLPSQLPEVIALLRNAQQNLSPAYQEHLAVPLIQYLENLKGVENTNELTPLELDLVQCLHENGQIHMHPHTRMVTRLIQGIYNRFSNSLSLSRSENLPALHFWSSQTSIYTLPRDYLKTLGIRVRMVAFPVIHQLGGVMGWSAFAHEIAGFALLDAKPEILEESREKIGNELKSLGMPVQIIQFFEKHWKNVVADVLGFLNLGPGSKGVIQYLSSLQADKTLQANHKEKEDPHFSNVLRVLLAKEVMRYLEIEDLPDVQLPSHFTLDNVIYSSTYFQISIQGIVKHLCQMPLNALGTRSLSAIRAWNVDDDYKLKSIQATFQMGFAIFQKGMYHLPAHSVENIISATVLAVLNPKDDPQDVISLMENLLSVADIDCLS